MPLLPELQAIPEAPLSIVLVTHNDTRLEPILRTWLNVLDTLKRDYEILVAGQTATDQEAEKAIQLASLGPNIRIAQQSSSVGFGSALRAGIAATRHPLLLYADASWSNVREDLKSCLEVVDKVHLVSGWRDRRIARRWPGWGELLKRLLIRFVFGVRLADPDCPFKLFRREVFSRIPIQSDSSFVHIEILAKANFLGKLMMDVSVKGQKIEDSGQRAEDTRQKTEDRGCSARWRDAWRVFANPDFGPATLPAGGMRGEDAVQSADSSAQSSAPTTALQ